MKNKVLFAFTVICILFHSCVHLPEKNRDFDEFTVAIVQFEIDPSLLKDELSYFLAISDSVEKAVEGGADLVVFPEYTAAFLAAIPYYEELEAAESFSKAVHSILQAADVVKSINELLGQEAVYVEAMLDRVFAFLADKYAVTILAGSYLAYENGNLYNRAVVFDQHGDILYTQDKVYLTALEADFLALEPGSLDDVSVFAIRDDVDIGITICRDTFFSAFETILTDADLWIDLKANGAAYTEAEAERFLRALPERLENVDVPYGVTVCLTGDFYNWFWEGRSSFLINEEDQQEFSYLSKSHDSFDIFMITLPVN